MAALRSHLKRAAVVLGTARRSAGSDQLPGETDEAGKRQGRGMLRARRANNTVAAFIPSAPLWGFPDCSDLPVVAEHRLGGIPGPENTQPLANRSKLNLR